MGLLDDAIREHLELKRRHGASDEEVTRLQDEVFGANAPMPAVPVAEELPEQDPVGEPAPPAPEPAEDELAEDAEFDADPLVPAEPEVAAEAAPEGEPAVASEPPVADVPAPPAPPAFTDAEPWLDEPDEVPAEESLDHGTSEYVTPDEGPEETEDVLEETPEFLQETPEHDRLWFEQKPPRDFDFGN